MSRKFENALSAMKAKLLCHCQKIKLTCQIHAEEKKAKKINNKYLVVAKF